MECPDIAAMIAHLILAHKPTEQLNRLIRKILHHNCEVFIHVDRKAEIQNFHTAINRDIKVHFIKERKEINWGGFSMVEATCTSFQEITSNSQKYDFINLLSQADYPLVNPEIIDLFFSKHKGKSFMQLEAKNVQWQLELRKKIQKNHLTDFQFKGKHIIERLINILPTNRNVPLGMELVGSSQWFTLALHHVEYILETIERHQNIPRFFRHTWGADEFFFQTILYNSPYRHEIINDNLRYIDWSESQPSPKILTADDFDALRKSRKFYARKFDQCIDTAILDKIDNFIKYCTPHV